MTEKNELFEGEVIWFNKRRGIGFIARKGEKDIFVHFTNIQMEGYKFLKQGQKVSFEIGQNHAGDQAVSVKVLEEPKDE